MIAVFLPKDGWRKWSAELPDWYAWKASSSHPDWYRRRVNTVRRGESVVSFVIMPMIWLCVKGGWGEQQDV